MSRSDVFMVDPPKDDSAGKYILIVQRAHGMFGSSATAFAVDGLEFTKVGDKVCSIRGLLDDKVMVEFSTDSSYIMTARTLIRSTNMTDIEIQDRRDAEVHQKRIDLEFPPEKQAAVDTTDDGRQRINTQGYL